MLEMWWLIAEDVVAHCWRCGGSLVKMWWLNGEDGLAYLEMWWLIAGYVVAHW